MILERQSKHRTLLFTIFCLALVAGVVVLLYGKAETRTGEQEPNAEIPSHVPEGWLATSTAGVSFSYPEQLPTAYITAVDWPPGAQVLHESFSCTEAGSEVERAGRTERRFVDGAEYCRTTILEGAAGSTYGQYAYAFERDDRTVILTFTTRFVQCDNYDDPSRQECRDEREAFDLDGLVDGIVRTVSVE